MEDETNAMTTSATTDQAGVEASVETETEAAPKATLKTEDTGKIFEKAICDAYGIPYDGPFQYSQADVDKLTPRLKRLVTDNLFPACVHTASKGARYDFTALGSGSDSGSGHLSAKSNKKKGGKIAPQVVGQSHPQKFCQELGIGYTTPEDLKQYIQANIMTVLPMLWKYTFDSPIVYYVKDTNDIRFITASGSPDWSSFQYVWTRTHDKWTNSSSLKVIIEEGCGKRKEESILEFQFHTKSRQNMAVRWTIDKVLRIFSGHFTVVSL
jgi:hypothetical protein